jgi:hypothetical protein
MVEMEELHKAEVAEVVAQAVLAQALHQLLVEQGVVEVQIA